ncbi:MAG: hypothetical protein HY858_08740 [Candidatus Solibacter usitatus]|nr:hypothetical protein [Candidatus Solibacter usitatus]
MRPRTTGLAVLALAFAGSAWGQSWNRNYSRHQIWGGLGTALPGQDLKPYYKPALAWSAGYGYRPLKFLQLDVGYDGAYNSADVRAYQDSGYGPLRIRDFQVFVPFGGRVIAPLAGGRLEIHGGGGGAYARYSEMLQQPGDWVSIGCPSCQARDGWGYYALLAGNIALDPGRHLRLGVTTRVYRIDTAGPRIGSLPYVRSSDQWVNTCATLTFSF